MTEEGKSNQLRNCKEYLIGWDGRTLSEEDFWLKFLDTFKKVCKEQHFDLHKLQMRKLPWSEIFSRWTADNKRSFNEETQSYLRNNFHFLRRKATGETGRDVQTRCKFATARMIESFKVFQDLLKEDSTVSDMSSPSSGGPASFRTKPVATKLPESSFPIEANQADEQFLSRSKRRNGKQAEEHVSFRGERRDERRQDFTEPWKNLSVPSPNKRTRNKMTIDDPCHFMREQFNELSYMFRESLMPTAYRDARQILTSSRSMDTVKSTGSPFVRKRDYNYSRALEELDTLKRDMAALIEQKSYTITIALADNLHNFESLGPRQQHPPPSENGEKEKESGMNEGSSESHRTSGTRGKIPNVSLGSSSLAATGEDREQSQQEQIQEAEDDLVEHEVPDPDFTDIDASRTENHLEAGQIWAMYDEFDCMPRFYVRIIGVTVRPFKVKFNWLEYVPKTEKTRELMARTGLSWASGTFELGKVATKREVNQFSHVYCSDGNKHVIRGQVKIYPKSNEVWAIYRDWDEADEGSFKPLEAPSASGKYSYDMVFTVSDFSPETGVMTVRLIKVSGYKTVFERQTGHVDKVFNKIFNSMRFAYNVPFRPVEEAVAEQNGLPLGSLELDPAAVPIDLILGTPSCSQAT